ncbi:MAG TPA: amino acid adenylation domain-containing protein, partial [Longimicrobiaceae bacterium]|nr:amino acid adenylation domain-containing protein [Longimicrobiaceae bacterium]
VIGTPTANRGRREIEGLIGFFVNTLALRLELSGEPSVGELLERVRERALSAQQNQDIPFEQVVEGVQPVRSLAHGPLFQVMFAWQSAPGDEPELSGLALAGVGRGAQQASAKYDLSLGLGESGGRIVGGVQYATALYERGTVERQVGYLRRVLDAMATGPERGFAGLEMLPEAERRQVLEEWNATAAAYPADRCIHELIEAQARRTPDAVALVFGERRLTYNELNTRANRLAHHLRALGVGPDAPVGICVERSAEIIVALLAVLKAGGAYVPLDPEYPPERLTYMLRDSAPVVMLTRGPLVERLGPLEVPVLDLEGDAAAWAHRPESDPARGELSPEHLAYMIYTSGSTGTPKGVLVPHRGLLNMVEMQRSCFGLRTDERVLQIASFGFDAAFWDVMAALTNGGTLCMPMGDAALPGPELLRFMREHRVTFATLQPTTLAVLSPEGLPELRTLVATGDACTADVVARWAPGRRFFNGYGPTETTIGATVGECFAGGGKPCIGRPLPNLRVYVFDPRGNPVPTGAAGELHVGGVGVVRGYLGRPELTAERFVPDPFSGEVGARLYRTGDRGRWLASGELEFLGRVDAQVKLRGYRVEPGEVERVLAAHADVREAAVIVREDAPGQKRLVAYWVGPEKVDVDHLRTHLRERLPEYMVPAAYVRLEEMPLTPNGKLDRRALPAPEGEAYTRRGYEAPVGEVEAALAAIWAEMLRVEHVGRWDHFFELGGHSLLAVQVVSRLRQMLGVEVPLGEVFRLPVLAEYARAVAAAAQADLPPVEPVDRTAPLPLSFAQQRLWFLEQLGGVGSAYHIPARLRLRGELDRGALRRALERIVARHEALRTTFPLVEGEPVQRVTPAGESCFHLTEHDLSGEAEAEAALHCRMAEEWSTPFDLERGPLIRGCLIRLGEGEHVLQVTMHHIVSDGWSMG